MAARNPGDEKRAKGGYVPAPHDFARPFIFAVFLFVTHEGLSERGTTHDPLLRRRNRWFSGARVLLKAAVMLCPLLRRYGLCFAVRIAKAKLGLLERELI